MFTLIKLNTNNATIHVAETLFYTLQEPDYNLPLHRLQDQHNFPLTDLAKIFKNKVTKM